MRLLIKGSTVNQLAVPVPFECKSISSRRVFVFRSASALRFPRSHALRARRCGRAVALAARCANRAPRPSQLNRTETTPKASQGRPAARRPVRAEEIARRRACANKKHISVCAANRKRDCAPPLKRRSKAGRTARARRLRSNKNAQTKTRRRSQPRELPQF